MHWLTHAPLTRLEGPLDDHDVVQRVLEEARLRPDGAPWVYTNMVSSIDGAATVKGLSGDLGGPADSLVFTALRATADVIIAGAETVRAEQYRLPRTPEGALGEWRAQNATTNRPRLCIVTRQGAIPEAARLVAELPSPPTADPLLRPIIATTVDAPTLADERFDVVRVSPGSVDLAALIGHLKQLGARRILCEGGPVLLGQFAAAKLIDEWNFTVAGAIASGRSKRAVEGDEELAMPIRLHRTIIHDDGTLLLRYLRPVTAGT